MDEQTTTAIYEPPVLVELGEFGEDTLGSGEAFPDSTGHQE
ncbi:MAG TPA: lasso RiPP family leader peptide-containing protein [Pseudonocardiaceae bacterium]